MKPLVKSSVLCGLLVQASVALAAAVPAESGKSFSSPDGHVSCAFSLDGGRPVADVSFCGRPVFRSSLGVERGALRVLRSDLRTVRSSWKPVWGFRSEYPENYTELSVKLGRADNGSPAETLYLRCYDEGFAVRAKFVMEPYTVSSLSGERTDWRFVPGAAAWAIPGTESTFPADPIPLADLSPDKAWRMPLTVRVPGVAYASIFEAHVEHYPRSYIRAERGILSPRFAMGVKEGRGETLTPWRAVALAATPAELVARAYLVENLNPPCAIADPSWIKPGFCVSDLGNFELRTHEIVAAARSAAATGAKYIQIDWGWYGTECPWTDDDRATYLSRHPEMKSDATWVENSRADPFTTAVGTVPYHPYWPYGGRTGVEMDMPKIVSELRAHGLGLCLYVHGAILENVDLDALFATYAKWGVVGLKPGFVGYGSQATTDFIRRLVAVAAKHRLWLDIHDLQLPDGIERTWPNLMITEGGGGEEGNHPVRQDVTLPFTRCLCGPFDYTPALFNAGKAGATKLHKLAMFAVYPGATAVMRGSIRNLVEKDPAAVEFLRALPWNYDETFVFDAEIARHLTVVRRKGDAFYIGGLTGDAAHETTITLDFLAPGRDYALTLLTDDPADASVPRGYRRETRTVRKGDVLAVKMSASGGFCGTIAEVAKNAALATVSGAHIAPQSDVRRVAMPSRLVRGDTNVRRLGPWDSAAWIWRKDAPLPPGGEFVRFRKAFSADGKSPLRFHVSADERFVLLLDGQVVARGPDRGTPEMWFVQSYETLPAAGDHLLEAVCWRLNPHQAPNAQLSVRGGFLFKAEEPFDAALTTGRADWRVAALAGTRMTRDAYPMGPVGAQCEVSGTGILAECPEAADYEKPLVVRGAIPPDESITSGSSRRPAWMLYPSELPAQIERTIRPGAFKAADDQAFATNGVWNKVARAYGRAGWYRASAAAHSAVAEANALLAGKGKVTIPPHAKRRILWDLGDYWCAYPELSTRGGKGAKIAWGWAESLYTGDCFDWHTLASEERKGATSRAKWEDKYFYGFKDMFCPDGRLQATFTTPWWRCGRWCQIEIETVDEPLTLEDIRLVETRYPLAVEGRFACDDPTIEKVERLCRRGLEMCMHEMYFDCPYYEQQMYGGDTRLQMLVASALSADGRLTRQGFRLFEMSQRDDGRVSMNYPTTWLQESTTYSLLWSLMLGDAALWRDDAAWVRARMPAVRKMLFGIEAHVGADGLVRNLSGWSFMDWVPEWNFGIAPGGVFNGGGSACENLLYLLALRSAAFVEDSLGETELAARWRRRAEALAQRINAAFWCEARGLVADTAAQDRFSEHAQCLAILADALPPERAKRAFDGLVSAGDLARCTVYFSHYLFETYFRFGRADLFLKRLDLWRDFAKQDLKTPLEAPGDARSDCHAWGAHPLYHFRTGLAGIRPTSAGFRSAEIAPCPGSLKHVEASVPTPRGAIAVDLRFDGDKVRGIVTVPEGLPATFKWRGATRNLAAGRNAIDTLGQLK